MLFGMTEAEFAEFAVRWGVFGLIAFMCLIIFSLARQSKAGKTGTWVLFLVLALGMGSFIAKEVIQAVLKI